MKKAVKVLAVIILGMMATINMFSQTVIADKGKVKDLTQKIRECEIQIERLNHDLSGVVDYSSEINGLKADINTISSAKSANQNEQRAKDSTLTVKRYELGQLQEKQKAFAPLEWKKVKRDALAVQLKKYTEEKNRLFDQYVANTNVPKELTPREERRRLRGLHITREDRVETNITRREELTFKKYESNPVIGDKQGFMGIIANDYSVPLIFKFEPLDGGESISPLVKARTMEEHKLIPGKYRVRFLNGGKEICDPIIISVNSVVTTYAGISCHWYTYMPSR
jgi:hypothetical protein